MQELFSYTMESKVVNSQNSTHSIKISVSWLTIAVVVGTILLHFFA